MNAHRALARSPEGIRVIQVPTPDPGQDGLVLAPVAVGICGTDVQILRKARADTASILGHEGLARVESVGTRTHGFRAGDTVLLNPVNPFDQEEILGHSSEGILQERRLVTAAELAWGLAVPATVTGLDPLVATLAEPLGAVLYGFDLVEQAVAPRNVVVVGAGPAGLLAVLSARRRGASRVLLVTNAPGRRDWVVERQILPEDCVLVATTLPLAAALLERTDGRKLDCAFLCTPRGSAMPMLKAILPAIREGGCVDLLGGFGDGDLLADLPDVDLNALRRANVCGVPSPGKVPLCRLPDGGRTIHVTGHRGTAARHLASAERTLFADPRTYAALITHRCSLLAAPCLLSQVLARGSRHDSGRHEFVKTVVDMRLEGHTILVADGPSDWQRQ